MSGCLSIEFPDEDIAKALYETLQVEVENPPDPDRGSTRVWVKNSVLYICFEARDFAAARALLNAYLSLASSSSDVVAVLKQVRVGG